VPGIWRGEVHLAPDFDAPNEEIIESFER
jgi:hypothetical protein